MSKLNEYAGPVYANRLRLKADFCGRGFAGLSVPGRRSFEAKAASPRMTTVD